MSIEYQPAPKTHGDIWAALHLPSRGTKLHEVMHQGLPFELLDQIATLVQMPCGHPVLFAGRPRRWREGQKLVVSTLPKAIAW